jgi:hypothetical protein
LSFLFVSDILDLVLEKLTNPEMLMGIDFFLKKPILSSQKTRLGAASQYRKLLDNKHFATAEYNRKLKSYPT